MIGTSDRHPIATPLAEVEQRLERALATGWRGAEGDVAELTRLANELSALGLTDFAARLIAVSEAKNAAEALRRIALAHAACGMLQSRLIAPLPAPPGLQPLPTDKDAPSARLLIIAPLFVAGEAVWACSRLERGVAVELALIAEPIAVSPTEVVQQVPAVKGPRGFLERLTRGSQPAETAPAPWLQAEIHEDLEWRATLPATGSEVGLYSAPTRSLHAPTEKEDIAGATRELLHAGRPIDNMVVVRAGGALRLCSVERTLIPAYVWLDPAVRMAFERLVRDNDWALAWSAGTSIMPLAIVRPGGLLRRAQLVPLTGDAGPLPLAD